MIRRLGPKDAGVMAGLHARAIKPFWAEAEMKSHLLTDICHGFGDPLTGFIIARAMYDQAEILTIVTDPDHRKTGIARKLLTESLSVLAGNKVEIVFLEVAEDNHPAQLLYKSSGFEQFGRRPAYYKRENGRVAALTFRKRLDA